MIHASRRSALACGIVACVASSAFAGLLGVQDSTLYDIDPLTGDVSNPRGVSAGLFAGIDFAPDGRLIGITGGEVLYDIDPITGNASRLFGVPLPFGEGDIAFDPITGLGFGVGASTDLFVVDFVRETAIGLNDLSSGAEDLSAMAFTSGGDLWAIDSGSDRAMLVNPWSGLVFGSFSLGIDVGDEAGLAIDPDTGLGFLVDGGVGSTNTLYTINFRTESVVPVGSTLAGGFSGLTYVPAPEPASALLLLAGAFALVRRR